MSWSGDFSPWRPEAPDGDDGAEATQRPLRSQFPGELGLREVVGTELRELSTLVVARFVVLQLAERYAAGLIEPDNVAAEVASAAEYIPQIREQHPADAMRLEQVLARIRAGDHRAIVLGLLAAGDTTLHRSHRLTAAGYYRASYELARHDGWNAAALSAASRLVVVTHALDRHDDHRQWDRRQSQLVARCQ